MIGALDNENVITPAHLRSVTAPRPAEMFELVAGSPMGLRISTTGCGLQPPSVRGDPKPFEWRSVVPWVLVHGSIHDPRVSGHRVPAHSAIASIVGIAVGSAGSLR